jgi:hypothetical protein
MSVDGSVKSSFNAVFCLLKELLPTSVMETEWKNAKSGSFVQLRTDRISHIQLKIIVLFIDLHLRL